MKCADCKFWERETNVMADEVGSCRRYAPRAVLQSPLALATLQLRNGSVGIDEQDAHDRWDVSSWADRLAAWPATFAEWGCGEFVAAKGPSLV
jgi:hypothetical protein